jgi:hypothetical protein
MKRVMPPTKDEQLIALKRVSGVPEDDWQKITEIATSLSAEATLESIRELVSCRRILLSPSLPHGPNEIGLEEKQRADRIAKVSKILLDDVNLRLGVASVFESPESDDAGNWLEFLWYLEKLCFRANLIAAPIRPPPHNVDGRRDYVWVRLMSLFERATGSKARVSQRAIDGHAFGKIVDFIQAFHHSVPGSSVPTAEEIRGVERKSRGERGEDAIAREKMKAKAARDMASKS